MTFAESSAASGVAPPTSNAAPPVGGGPSPRRAVVVLVALVALVLWLTLRVETGEDNRVRRLGRIEVTARLVECPEQFPNLGAYRYTYTVRYEVVAVHRQDPEGRYPLRPGDSIFVGHYKPWLPRAQIQDADWGTEPLGGRASHLGKGQVHRLALDYELADLAPSGVLDYLYPPGTNRFFALWTNPTSL